MVLRQQVWVDRSVQGVLIGRIVLYWFVGIAYLGLGSACYQYYQHPNFSFGKHASVLFNQFWPWMPSLILFLPLVIFDIARLSNLFAGPIYRLRVHLAELNEDPTCRPLKFRDDDYWQDLAEPIHNLQATIVGLQSEVERLRHAKAKPEPSREFKEDSARDPLSDLDLDMLKSLFPAATAAPPPGD